MRPQVKMPEISATVTPLALDVALNRIVRFQVVANPGDAEEVIALLPGEVRLGLVAELRACEEAHRYALQTQRAYYFRSAGRALNIWIWNEVESYEEAANLLTLIVNLPNELGEEQANDLYERATGRRIDQSHANPPDSQPDN